MSNYDARLVPRERAGMWELKCHEPLVVCGCIGPTTLRHSVLRLNATELIDAPVCDRCGLLADLDVDTCEAVFEAGGDHVEGAGVYLADSAVCPECGGEEHIEVIGEAEPPEPDYDAYRERDW